MHGSFKTEKMSPSVVSDSPRHDWRTPMTKNAKRSKTKGKDAYSSARKLKESTYVWSD
jgi:hypothetical protein